MGRAAGHPERDVSSRERELTATMRHARRAFEMFGDDPIQQRVARQRFDRAYLSLWSGLGIPERLKARLTQSGAPHQLVERIAEKHAQRLYDECLRTAWEEPRRMRQNYAGLIRHRFDNADRTRYRRRGGDPRHAPPPCVVLRSLEELKKEMQKGSEALDLDVLRIDHGEDPTPDTVSDVPDRDAAAVEEVAITDPAAFREMVEIAAEGRTPAHGLIAWFRIQGVPPSVVSKIVTGIAHGPCSSLEDMIGLVDKIAEDEQVEAGPPAGEAGPPRRRGRYRVSRDMLFSLVLQTARAVEGDPSLLEGDWDSERWIEGRWETSRKALRSAYGRRVPASGEESTA